MPGRTWSMRGPWAWDAYWVCYPCRKEVKYTYLKNKNAAIRLAELNLALHNLQFHGRLD